MNGRPALLIDDRARPPLRARIGLLLAGADEAAFAIARIRLAVLDFSDRELGRLRRCRVLLGQLDASMLLDASAGAARPASHPASHPAGASAGPLGSLLRFAASGRLEVRSAGLVGWAPDFAVVRRGAERTGLLGSIQFGNPELAVGPTFTALIEDPDATRMLQLRFDEVWDRSHDVLPAIQAVLERVTGLGDPSAARRGDSDPE